MSHNAALIVALVLPAFLFVMLRINAAMIFLSLCLGAVLVEYVATDANSLLALFSSRAGSFSASTIQLILLLGPAAVTTVVTLFSLHGRMKVMLNIFPAMSAALLGVLLAVPLLPLGLRYALQSQGVWHELVQAQALVVGVGALMSLFFLWMQRAHFKQPEKKRH